MAILFLMLRGDTEYQGNLRECGAFPLQMTFVLKNIESSDSFQTLMSPLCFTQYIPVHTQPFYKSIGFKENNFPNTIKYSKRAISIPLYCVLTFNQQKYICSSLRNTIENF